MIFGAPVTLDDVFDVAMIRERPYFIPLPTEGVRLHMGNGNKWTKGWTHLDYPEWDAESTPDRDIKYSPEEVDAILVLHTLDHLSAEAVVHFLKEVEYVLKPGGTLTVVVPHHMSTLAHECIEHKTQYGIKTWRNILNNPSYQPLLNGVRREWNLEIGFNMVMGVEERNLVLITQLVKR